MATEKRLIRADETVDAFTKWLTSTYDGRMPADIVNEIPTVDAVEVVFCDYCVKHGGCYTEDVFRIARIEKPYCCAGKKDGERNA